MTYGVEKHCYFLDWPFNPQQAIKIFKHPIITWTCSYVMTGDGEKFQEPNVIPETTFEEETISPETEVDFYRYSMVFFLVASFVFFPATFHCEMLTLQRLSA